MPSTLYFVRRYGLVEGMEQKSTSLKRIAIFTVLLAIPVILFFTISCRDCGQAFSPQFTTIQAYLGDTESQYILGKTAYSGQQNKPRDISKTIHWLTKAANKGNVDAQNFLGYIYTSNKDVAQDYKKALGWFEKAATQGNSYSQISLGMFYFYGLGTKKDESVAFTWFEKAAKQGNPIPQSMLGYMYLTGIGTQKNEDKAFVWLEKAALGGIAEAQLNLADMYMRGYVADKNRKKLEALDPNTYFEELEKIETDTLKYYMLAAEQNLPRAQRGVGEVYELRFYNGHDPENAKKAIEWFKKAANQGDVKSQANIGNMYGNINDYATAFQWYQMAAEKNDTYSQGVLGLRYEQGLGVSKDYIQAYKWFTIAGKNQHKDAKFHLNNIAVKMTPEQIAEAQRLAREWKPKTEKLPQ